MFVQRRFGDSLMASLRLFSLMAVSILGGCSTVDSYPANNPRTRPDQYNTGQASGSYYLPKHLVKATFTGTASQPTVTFATRAVADSKAEMRTGMNLSGFSDDTIKISYANGMLDQVSSVNDDKTADILINIAKTAGAFLDEQLGTRSVEFDPYDRLQTRMANEIIRKTYPGFCIDVELSAGVWNGCQEAAGLRAEYVASPLPRLPGIYYRRAVPHLIRLLKGGRPYQMESVLMANASPIYRVDIKRTAFVKRETLVKFKDGELTNVEVTKPSEGVAIASLPISIVSAIIAGPVDALTQRKAVQEARAALYTAQANTLKERVALEKARLEAEGPGSGAEGSNLSVGIGDLADCRQAGYSDPAICRAIIQSGK